MDNKQAIPTSNSIDENIKYLVVEANKQIEKDSLKIKEYLEKQNLCKDNIKPFSFLHNNVLREVNFKLITYYSFIKEGLELNEPFVYYGFESNKGQTHYNYLFHNEAYKYVLFEGNKVGRFLDTSINFTIQKPEHILIVASITKTMKEG